MEWLDSGLKSLKARAGAVSARVSPKARRRMAWTGGGVFGALIVLILFFGLVDWNLLKRPVENVLSSRMDRPVHIDGNLKVHLLSWTPSASLEGLRIGNPAWVGGGETARIQRLAIKVKLMPLFKGDVILPLVQVDRPVIRLVRQADGRNNWTFGKKQKPLALPAIRRFEINQGQATLNDAKRNLLFAGTVNSREIVDNRNVEAFKLIGVGTLNQAPFSLILTGGPLLNVDPNRPYPFDAKMIAGDSHIAATGSIAKPFDLGVFDTSLAISGQDLAGLYHLTGLALPNTPPYSLSGHLARRGFTYTYSGVSGRFGSTDVGGFVSVRTGGAKPYLSGDVRSRHLDWADLAAVIGGGASTVPSAKASPQQAQTARRMAATVSLFPDTELHVERLRSMDAHVKYSAAQITSKTLPLRSGSVDLTLDNGVMTFNPVTLQLSNGRVTGTFALNAQGATPAMNTDLRLSGARIDDFIPASYKGAASGDLLARARLSSTGKSVRQAAANANGQVSFVAPHGEMRSQLAELLGVNVLKALFDNPEKKTELRCAVADFKVTGGMMNAQTIVLDTGPVIATGGGYINLKDERMDLRLRGHPKEVRLIRLRIPLQLSGPLRRPHLGVEAGAAVGQAGIAAVVGAVLSPLAAILPFVDSGMAKDANCQGLIAQAGTGHPAPVQTTAAGTPAKKAG